MSSFRLVKLIDPLQIVNIPSGLVPKGEYDNSTTYDVGDSVSYNGSSYIMYSSATAGTLPTDTDYWQILASKGDSGAYTVVTETSATRNETSTSGHIVILCDCTSNNITINLPTAIGNIATITVKKIDSSTNTVTIDGYSSQTIDNGGIAILQVMDEAITIISDNSDWRII